jgi:hypothetical protein
MPRAAHGNLFEPFQKLLRPGSRLKSTKCFFRSDSEA